MGNSTDYPAVPYQRTAQLYNSLYQTHPHNSPTVCLFFCATLQLPVSYIYTNIQLLQSNICRIIHLSASDKLYTCLNWKSVQLLNCFNQKSVNLSNSLCQTSKKKCTCVCTRHLYTRSEISKIVQLLQSDICNTIHLSVSDLCEKKSAPVCIMQLYTCLDQKSA